MKALTHLLSLELNNNRKSDNSCTQGYCSSQSSNLLLSQECLQCLLTCEIQKPNIQFRRGIPIQLFSRSTLLWIPIWRYHMMVSFSKLWKATDCRGIIARFYWSPVKLATFLNCPTISRWHSFDSQYTQWTNLILQNLPNVWDFLLASGTVSYGTKTMPPLLATISFIRTEKSQLSQ